MRINPKTVRPCAEESHAPQAIPLIRCIREIGVPILNLDAYIGGSWRKKKRARKTNFLAPPASFLVRL
jgi:hypothetical protein